MKTMQKIEDNTEKKAPALVANLPTRIAFSMREAAQILGVSYPTMQRLVARGLIRSSSALRTKIIPMTELERFLAE